MLTFRKKIDIVSFTVSSNEISYVNDNKELIFRDKIITKNTSDCGFFLNKKYFFYTNEENYKTRFLNVEKNEVININGFISPHYQTFIKNSFVANEYVDLINYQKNLIYFNISTLEKRIIKENISFGVRERVEDYIIINEGRYILKSLSLLTGAYEWQIDLSHYRYKRAGERHEARIQQVIGVWEGQLLVWMDGNKFLSLSVETGELLWEIRQWEYSQGKGYGYQFGQGVHLDEAKGKCYLFEGTCYMEIDLATQKATILWQEDIITYGRLFGRPNFTPDYIYFLIGGVCSTSVGVFDRKTLQIVWQYDFVFDQSGAEYIMLNQPPQVADNKLYVLDTGGTLHIFERTED